MKPEKPQYMNQLCQACGKHFHMNGLPFCYYCSKVFSRQFHKDQNEGYIKKDLDKKGG